MAIVLTRQCQLEPYNILTVMGHLCFPCTSNIAYWPSGDLPDQAKRIVRTNNQSTMR